MPSSINHSSTLEPTAYMFADKTAFLRLPCVTCGRYFRNQSGLTKHQRIFHLHSVKPRAPVSLPPTPLASPTHEDAMDTDDDTDDDNHSGNHGWGCTVEDVIDDNDNEMGSNPFESGENLDCLGGAPPNVTLHHPHLNGKHQFFFTVSLSHIHCILQVDLATSMVTFYPLILLRRLKRGHIRRISRHSRTE